jgi:Flp pilus assembly protein TadG
MIYRYYPCVWRPAPGKRHQSGATAVEFAIVAPVFVLALMAIASYGGYFWLAHSVQQLANDGARSAIAGLNQSERQQLAQSTVSAEVTSYAALKPALTTVAEVEQSGAITVTVSYDATNSGFWLVKFLPMPSTTIARSATVKLGGF